MVTPIISRVITPVINSYFVKPFCNQLTRWQCDMNVLNSVDRKITKKFLPSLKLIFSQNSDNIIKVADETPAVKNRIWAFVKRPPEGWEGG